MGGQEEDDDQRDYRTIDLHNKSKEDKEEFENRGGRVIPHLQGILHTSAQYNGNSTAINKYQLLHLFMFSFCCQLC